MPLDRDKVQTAAALAVVAPLLPGREEVRAEAKPGLEHDELLAAAPALRQPGAIDEDLPGLAESSGAARVDIAVSLAVGRAGRIACQSLGLQGHA